MALIGAVVSIVHLLASLLFAAFGLHRLMLAWAYWHRIRPATSKLRWAPRAFWPSVTVQIPLYNERYVADRVIDAVGRLDYPVSALEIQVIDDSTDETSVIVSHAVARLRAEGLTVHELRRDSRHGFKAGALEMGLRYARGELIAIFDADFIPAPDFLLRVVPEFDDRAIGMVQTRWSHLNRNTSLLTRAQGLQLDAHFRIEHAVRAVTGCFFNFNGTAGIWRKEAIKTAGGWCVNTLTEDLDLSYRAQLAGWRFVYRDDITVPGELPVEIAAYRSQQQRWAQGAIQTACRMLPLVFRAPLRGAVKREAAWHLLQHLAYPLALVLALTGYAIGWLADVPQREWIVMTHGALLSLATASVAVFYGVAAGATEVGRWRQRLLSVPVIMILGMGIACSQTAAVFRGLMNSSTAFRRTPKYRLGNVEDTSWRATAYRLSTRGALVEGLTGLGIIALAFIVITWGSGAPGGIFLLIGLSSLALGIAAMKQNVGRIKIGIDAERA